MDRQIIHDQAEKQFVLPLENNHKAFIIYRINGQQLLLTHAEVPYQLRGQGLGKELVEKTFELIEKSGYTATAQCSYISAVAKRSNYWSKIINH